MKKTIFALITGTLLTAGMLSTSCKGKMTINSDKGTDTIEFNTENIKEINIDVETNYEENEADDSGMMGLASYASEEMDISELPSTAEKQDIQGKLELYVNIDEQPSEDDPAGTYSVWLADKKNGKAIRLLKTNSTATGMWNEMRAANGGVAVEMHLIAAATKAMFATKDGKKIVVEGCPDARNVFTYLIDLPTRTAMQLPGTEGVQLVDRKKGEITIASYGYYDEGGRYTYTRTFDLKGKFLRESEKEPE